ncbi:MAG: hypothetical protein AB7T10_04795 [bacterium]
MKNLACFVISLIIFAEISADYALSDENGKTIEAGEYVYICNTAGLDGFSIDFNKQLFADGGIVRDEGNRILIGRLRDDLRSGTADTLIINTIDGMDYLELKISPMFSEIELNERISEKDTLISGFISFESRGKTTLSGIDSVKLIVTGSNENDSKEFKIYTAEETEDKRQMIDFELMMHSGEDEYAVSVAHYSLSLAETTFYAGGFSTKVKEEYPKNLLIIDSRSRVTTENLSELYYDNRFENIKTFYEKCDSNIIKVSDDGIIVLVIVEGGFILQDLDLFSRLRNESKRVPLFIFANKLGGYLSNEENRAARDYLDMLFDADFSSAEVSDMAECEAIKSLEETEAEIVSAGGRDGLSFIKKENIYLFLYLPERIDVDQLYALKKNWCQSAVKEKMKTLSSVVDIEYMGYGEYSVEIFDVKGAHLFTQNVGELPATTKSLDMAKFLKEKNLDDTGVYTYKVIKDDEEIKCGKFYYIYY